MSSILIGRPILVDLHLKTLVCYPIYMKYTKELIEAAVKESKSYAETMRKLGITYISGGMQTYLIKRVKEFQIDTTHFTGQGWTKGKLSLNRKTAKDILVYSKSNFRQKASQLRRALLESEVEYKCAECNLSGTWNGKPICLEVDHIDSDYKNNTIDNLQFLCPNCHSQKPSYSNGRESALRTHTVSVQI